MSKTDRPFARLILKDDTRLRLDPFLETAERVLAAEHPTVCPRRIATKGAVLGAKLGVRFKPETDGIYGPSMRLEVVSRDTASIEDPQVMRLLSNVVARMLADTQCDLIEWVKPGALISAQDFAELRAEAGFDEPDDQSTDGAVTGRGSSRIVSGLHSCRAGVKTIGRGILSVIRSLGRRRAPLLASAPVIMLAVALSMTDNAHQMASVIFP